MSDLISREDAIKAIYKSTEEFTGFLAMEMYTEEDAINAIKSVPSASQWIPCSERLPSDGKYLCTIDYYGELIDICSYAHNLHEVDKYAFSETGGGWYNCDSEYGYYERENVTAWMPLPTPYKEDP